MVDNAIKNPIIRHFETPGKPWLTNKNFYDVNIDLQNFEDFWFFAKMTDFYEILKFKYFNGLLESKEGKAIINSNCLSKKTKLELFNIIPLLKIIRKNNKTYYKLFEFIPLLKVIDKNNKIYYKLFNFIPLLVIKNI